MTAEEERAYAKGIRDAVAIAKTLIMRSGKSELIEELVWRVTDMAEAAERRAEGSRDLSDLGFDDGAKD